MSATGTTSVVTLPDGRRGFQKSLKNPPPGFFRFEAAGLEALRAFGARVPEVYEVTDNRLVIQLIDTSALAGGTSARRRSGAGWNGTARDEAERSGAEGKGASRDGVDLDGEFVFGQELAELHLRSQQSFGQEPSQTGVHAQQAPSQGPGQGMGSQSTVFGSLAGLSAWYLGAAEIDLTPTDTLYESLVVNRVHKLTEQAVSRRLLCEDVAQLAHAITPEHLGPVEPPTLVHGDLWAGNRVVDGEGRSWLIDPSCHWGHREQDIAMMHLFGGFGPTVMEGYQEVFPLAEGWQERIPVFQLVPLLAHLILFGSGYETAVRNALNHVKLSTL